MNLYNTLMASNRLMPEEAVLLMPFCPSLRSSILPQDKSKEKAIKRFKVQKGSVRTFKHVTPAG